jgi:hypothetical protein
MLVQVMIAGLFCSSATAAPRANHDHADDRLGNVMDDETEDDKDNQDDGVAQYVQELFLGISVYPQDENEVQLTWGLFNGAEVQDRSLAFLELEYGITDRFQIGFELPYEFGGDEILFDGTRNVGVELYYNFYSDRRTGRAYGVGFELGLPADAPAGESRGWVYEPFVIAYQDFGGCAVNLSAALEIVDFRDGGEDPETAGELAFAVFGPVGPFVPILELGLEIAAEETPLRVAPGLYWHPRCELLEFGVSVPIGLNRDAPDFGVFLLAIVEFDAHALAPCPGKATAARSAFAGR